jgi:hypothetical protein
VPALKSWKRADGNVSFITNELIKPDTSKQYLAAVENIRALDQISRELHTNIYYKDKTKHTLKLLIMTIHAAHWDPASGSMITRQGVTHAPGEKTTTIQ